MTDPSILSLAKSAVVPAYGFNKHAVLFASALLAAEEENAELRKALKDISEAGVFDSPVVMARNALSCR